MQIFAARSVPQNRLAVSGVPLLALLLFGFCFAVASSVYAGDETSVKHSFLGVGKANQAVIIGEDGEVEWKFDMPASDGWVLPNGNVLLALYGTKDFPNGGVVEVDRKTKQILFQYKGRQKETSTVQPLPDGTFLIAELGPEPRAIIVNRDGEIVKTTPLQCQKENTHMQTRMLRLLPNGNYLAPHLLDFAVKEYNPATGEVVQVIKTDERGREKRDWPFTAIRLENGNTVIASYRTKGDQVKLFEVTPEKKVVWRYSGMKSGFHHFQILTTNGKPVKANTWK